MERTAEPRSIVYMIATCSTAEDLGILQDSVSVVWNAVTMYKPNYQKPRDRTLQTFDQGDEMRAIAFLS
jgi:hypothetical protein